MSKTKQQLSILAVIILLILAFAGGFYIRPFALPNKLTYSESIQFVIDNPEYADRLFQGHKNHIQAAEQLMLEQLDAMSGEPTTEVGN